MYLVYCMNIQFRSINVQFTAEAVATCFFAQVRKPVAFIRPFMPKDFKMEVVPISDVKRTTQPKKSGDHDITLLLQLKVD